MMLEAAAPIFDYQNHLIGILYGGILLNRNYEIVDGLKVPFSRTCNIKVRISELQRFFRMTLEFRQMSRMEMAQERLGHVFQKRYTTRSLSMENPI